MDYFTAPIASVAAGCSFSANKTSAITAIAAMFMNAEQEQDDEPDAALVVYGATVLVATHVLPTFMGSGGMIINARERKWAVQAPQRLCRRGSHTAAV